MCCVPCVCLTAEFLWSVATFALILLLGFIAPELDNPVTAGCVIGDVDARRASPLVHALDNADSAVRDHCDPDQQDADASEGQRVKIAAVVDQ